MLEQANPNNILNTNKTINSNQVLNYSKNESTIDLLKNYTPTNKDINNINKTINSSKTKESKRNTNHVNVKSYLSGIIPEKKSSTKVEIPKYMEIENDNDKKNETKKKINHCLPFMI